MSDLRAERRRDARSLAKGLKPRPRKGLNRARRRQLTAQRYAILRALWLKKPRVQHLGRVTVSL